MLGGDVVALMTIRLFALESAVGEQGSHCVALWPPARGLAQQFFARGSW